MSNRRISDCTFSPLQFRKDVAFGWVGDRPILLSLCCRKGNYNTSVLRDFHGCQAGSGSFFSAA